MFTKHVAKVTGRLNLTSVFNFEVNNTVGCFRTAVFYYRVHLSNLAAIRPPSKDPEFTCGGLLWSLIMKREPSDRPRLKGDNFLLH